MLRTGIQCSAIGIIVALTIAEAARIHILHTRDHARHKRDLDGSRDRMPHEMALRVDIDADQSVNLNLTRNDHVASLVPVIVGEGGNIKQWQSSNKENYAVYTDTNNNAAMFVKASHENSGQERHQFMGMFQKGDEEFIVEPANGGFSHHAVDDPRDHVPFSSLDPIQENSSDWSSQTPPSEATPPETTSPVNPPPHEQRRRSGGRRRHKRALEEDLEAIDYVIRAVDRSDLTEEYVTVPLTEERDIFRDEILEITPPQFVAGIEEYVSYGVESLVVVDYAIYKRYYDQSDEPTSRGKRDDAINSVRYYYSHIINGIDLRYMSIQEPDFGLYVRLAGFYIPTTPEDSPWTEADDLREVDNETGRIYTHAYKGLGAFEVWLSDTQRELPFFDQASLFVGNKLFGGYSTDGIRRNIAGLGEIAGICTYYKTALVQENGPYATVQTASHEMGHNLGALHDGSQNECDRQDQYVMAPVPTTLNVDNFYNPYTFSPCSVDEFREQIRVLNLRDMNCLTNEARHLDEAEIERHLQIPPGQMFSLDEQCMNIFGVASYYCAGSLNDAIMCLELVCYDPYQERCWKGPERRAATGTTCDNKKWCVQGRCEYEAAAPEAADYCLTGDYRGKFQGSFTCQDIEQETPYKCYRDHYQRSCCGLCQRIFNHNRPECPYGDRQEWCISVGRSDCYDERQRHDCCQTCERLQTGITGCEFGSKATWCAKDVRVNPAICYQSWDICCEACPRYAIGPPDCLYGDRTSWCSAYRDRPWECYNTIGDQCCGLCQRVHERYGLVGPYDCEYGDHTEKCSPYMCDNPRNWQRCCYTCRWEAGFSRPPTTLSTTTVSTTTTTPTTATTPTTTTSTTTSPPTTTSTTIPTATPTTTSSTTRRTTPSTTPSITSTSSTTTPTTISDTATTTRTSTTSSTSSPATVPVSEQSSQPGPPAQPYTTPSSPKPKPDSTTIHSTLPSTSPSTATTIPTTTERTTPSITTLRDIITTRRSTSPLETHPTLPDEECVDRASWCKNTSSTYCYSVHEICCDLCQRARIPIPKCEYGDHYMWCLTMDINNCQYTSYQLDCCITCRDFIPKQNETLIPTTPETTATVARTTTPQPNDQPCRDNAKWCGRVSISHCYEINETCCARCAQHWTGIPGCEYGDHYGWCPEEDLSRCSRPEIQQGCCIHCNSTPSGTYPPTPYTTLTSTTTTTIASTTTTTTTSPTPTTTTQPITSHSVTSTKHPGSNGTDDLVDYFSFCETEIGRSECYFEGYRSGCQKTCHKFRTNIEGCEFGDMNTWCETIQPSACAFADYRIHCCQTCALDNITLELTTFAEFQTTSVTDTTMGTTYTLNVNVSSDCQDTASWCPKIPASNCYVEEETCCRTCDGFYSGEGGCEYGNQVQWCADTIVDPSDCLRKDIIHNCCGDCISYGYILPELAHESSEGILIEILSTKLELLERQKALIDSISSLLSEFCRSQVSLCCEVLHARSNQTSRPDDLVRTDDVTIATGYPREDDDTSAIIDKLLVHVTPERLDSYCQPDSLGQQRRKRDLRSDLIYFDKTFLKEVLNRYERRIEEDADLVIVKFEEPATVSDVPDQDRSAMIYATVIGIIAAIGAVVTAYFIAKKYKLKKPRKVASDLLVPDREKRDELKPSKKSTVGKSSRVMPSHPPQSPDSTLPRGRIPTVYHSNSFTRNPADRPLCVPRDQSTSDKARDGAWKETMLCLEEKTEYLYGHGLPDILTPEVPDIYYTNESLGEQDNWSFANPDTLSRERNQEPINNWELEDENRCILKNEY